MATIPIIRQSIDEVSFIIDYIAAEISAYDLSELTNSNTGDVPSIVGAHPLAMEYGNLVNSSDPDNYTSILPAIGVELINDDEHGQQYLGTGYKSIEIDQDFIDEMDALSIQDRFKEGYVLSDTNLTAIKDAKTAKGSEVLWATTSHFLQNQNVNISIWSDHPSITRILYVVMRSILKKLKVELSSKGVRNTKITGQGSIYNFEFGGTLYGAEFNATFVNTHRGFDVDADLLTIKQVDESVLGVEDVSKPEFKEIGG